MDLEDILREDGQIRKRADFQRTLVRFLPFGDCRSSRVSPQSLLKGQRLAGGGRVDRREHQVGHPVGADGERNAGCYCGTDRTRTCGDRIAEPRAAPAGSMKCEGSARQHAEPQMPADIGLAAADRHVRCAAARAGASAPVRSSASRTASIAGSRTACTIGCSPAAHPTIQVGPISRLPATAQDPPRTRRRRVHARCCLRRRGDSGGRGRFPTQAAHMPRAHGARSLRLRRQARPTYAAPAPSHVTRPISVLAKSSPLKRSRSPDVRANA